MRDFEFYYTQDGSIGLYSYADDDVYHSKFGALTEAWEKFIIPSELEKKLNKQESIKVLDVCYGIGYNTKALMSYVINKNEKYFIEKNVLKKLKNKIKKINLNLKKKFIKNIDIEAIDDNKNLALNDNLLLPSIETVNCNNVSFKTSNIKIDCLEINKNLVKISPLIKTVITPQEIFSRIIPKIFDCFESYWKIKKFLKKLSFKLLPKNKREIKEILDLKFSNDYDVLEQEYRIHKFVNYILVDKLAEHYKDNYFDKEFNKLLKEKGNHKFLEPSLFNYAKFKQNSRYNFISKLDLSTCLHNIYYDHLSNRYKNAPFKSLEGMFNVNFYVDDARKAILNINEQYDLMFLDAFTFSKAPELWTVEFMAELYRRLSPTGLVMTYSNSVLVRNTFLENNFYVGKIFDEKTNKFIGTIAAKEKSLIKYPLSNYEIGLCNTRAGIPYHDPTLSYTKEQILKNRELEFKNSELLTSSQYFKSRSQQKDEGELDE